MSDHYSLEETAAPAAEPLSLANAKVHLRYDDIIFTAGSFVIGETYTIKTAGTTNFTLIGAADSVPGTSFVATGAGTGTGTAALGIEDTLINTLIKAARKRLEADTGRALITQTWDLFLDRFPVDDGPIYIPKPPVQSITSIKYIDSDGVEQTWDGANYRTDLKSAPARITPAYNVSYPTARDITNAVTVRFVCGYGAAGSDVEDDLVQAVKLLVGHWYEFRESILAGIIVAEVPQTYTWLHWPHRIWV